MQLKLTLGSVAPVVPGFVENSKNFDEKASLEETDFWNWVPQLMHVIHGTLHLVYPMMQLRCSWMLDFGK